MSMINFYKMPGCGFCVRAEQMLKSHIDSGVITIVPHTDAQPGISGFPHFDAPSTGKTHTGAPSSANELFSVLGLKEPFRFRRFHEGFCRRAVERMHHKKQKDEIHFFSMEGCGWCKKAKEMLKPLIDSGKVIIKDASEASSEVSGFPHFVSQLTGESMSGLAAKNVSDFLQKLGHAEKFLHGISHAVRGSYDNYDMEGRHHMLGQDHILQDPRTLEGYGPRDFLSGLIGDTGGTTHRPGSDMNCRLLPGGIGSRGDTGLYICEGSNNTHNQNLPTVSEPYLPIGRTPIEPGGGYMWWDIKRTTPEQELKAIACSLRGECDCEVHQECPDSKRYCIEGQCRETDPSIYQSPPRRPRPTYTPPTDPTAPVYMFGQCVQNCP